VTCGGVRLSEVNFTTMESRRGLGLLPNFAGELLDVDGITGGFNFHGGGGGGVWVGWVGGAPPPGFAWHQLACRTVNWSRLIGQLLNLPPARHLARSQPPITAPLMGRSFSNIPHKPRAIALTGIPSHLDRRCGQHSSTINSNPARTVHTGSASVTTITARPLAAAVIPGSPKALRYEHQPLLLAAGLSSITC